jgi:imidazolonepropionase-like amidohydrolase
MKKIITLVLIVTAFIATAQQQFYLTADRVFDGEEIHEGWAVLIQGDKIISTGPKEKVIAPSNAIKINYPNSTITPGLIEGHSHLLLYP